MKGQLDFNKDLSVRKEDNVVGGEKGGGGGIARVESQYEQKILYFF